MSTNLDTLKEFLDYSINNYSCFDTEIREVDDQMVWLELLANATEVQSKKDEELIGNQDIYIHQHQKESA